MNCWDLTLETIRIMDDIDRLVARKSKSIGNENEFLDDEINRKELRLFEIKKILQSKNTY